VYIGVLECWSLRICSSERGWVGPPGGRPSKARAIASYYLLLSSEIDHPSTPPHPLLLFCFRHFYLPSASVFVLVLLCSSSLAQRPTNLLCFRGKTTASSVRIPSPLLPCRPTLDRPKMPGPLRASKRHAYRPYWVPKRVSQLEPRPENNAASFNVST